MIYGKLSIQVRIEIFFKEGLLKATDGKKILKTVEQQCFGPSGVLEDHLDNLQNIELNEKYTQSKKRKGYGTVNLIGKYGRIYDAIINPNSPYRYKAFRSRKKTGLNLKIGFKTRMFPKTKSGSSITKVLQNGRLAGFNLTQDKLHGKNTLGKATALAIVKNQIPSLRSKFNTLKGVEAIRTQGFPVMLPDERDRAKIDPVLDRAIMDEIKAKRLG